MDNKLLAKVDGREIRESDYQTLVQSLGKNASYFKGEDGRHKLIEELIMHEMIYSDAVENNYEAEEEFQEVIGNMKKSLLQQYGLSKIINSVQVSDDEVKEYYESNKSTYMTESLVKASHILVQTKEEADEILEELTDGMPFEEAAKKYSKCPSKAIGGDLGQFGRGQMVPEFDAAVFAMGKGEISEPVKTEFGYHIIKLVDIVPERNSSLDEAWDEVKKECLMIKQNHIYVNKQRELVDKYKVEIFE